MGEVASSVYVCGGEGGPGEGWAASLVCVLMFIYFASASGARWARCVFRVCHVGLHGWWYVWWEMGLCLLCMCG